MRRIRVFRPLSQDQLHVVINELLVAQEHNAISAQATHPREHWWPSKTSTNHTVHNTVCSTSRRIIPQTLSGSRSLVWVRSPLMSPREEIQALNNLSHWRKLRCRLVVPEQNVSMSWNVSFLWQSVAFESKKELKRVDIDTLQTLRSHTDVLKQEKKHLNTSCVLSLCRCN